MKASQTGTLPEATEEAPCPLCGSKDRQALHRFGAFGAVRCRSCGLDFLSPRLTETAMLEVYRSAEYFEGGAAGYASYEEQELALRATFRRVARNLVRAGFGGGDLLEVGCGYGFFLEEASHAFRSCIGTEMSERAAATARARGLDVATGGLEALPNTARFDCVFSGHVIEHIYDPRPFIEQLAGLLRPGGVLVLGTPDGGSLWRRVLGRRWPSYKIPEHVIFFDAPALSRLFTGAGLVDVRPFSYPHAFPLALIWQRLGLARFGRLLGTLGQATIWVPATTVAVSGRRTREVGDVT